MIETESCQKPEIRPTQNCPEFNREGFYFEDEFSSDWEDLEQTKVLLFHAWIAEYANIRRIVEETDGRKRVMFQARVSIIGWLKLLILILNYISIVCLPF